MFVKLRVVVLLALLAHVWPAFSQVKNYGLPFIKNYFTADYGTHPLNYSAVQDKRGMIYVGNAYGLLEYDGVSWKHIPLPNGISALSMDIDPSGTIYVGAAGDIGYLKADSSGFLRFNSLLDLVPRSEQGFGDVIHTFVQEDRVVYVTIMQVMIYKGGKITIVKPTQPNATCSHIASEINGSIYLIESGRLARLSEAALVPVKGAENVKEIYAVLPYKKSGFLLLTSKGAYAGEEGNFTLADFPVNEFLSKHPVATAIPLKGGFVAIGTAHQGLLIIDSTGKAIQYITKHEGLSSNALTGLYMDSAGNLWVTTDNGISFIEISSPFTYINEQHGIDGSGSVVSVHDGKIFLGTSQGVYYNQWLPYINPLDPHADFKLIEETRGMTRSFVVAGNEMLAGHTKGVFKIRNGKGELISPELYSGGWTFRYFNDSNYIVAGTFAGLELYERKPGGWSFKWKIKGFTESARILEIENDNTIWVCHGNKGLYRLKISDGKDKITEVKNLSDLKQYPPDFFNDVTRVRGKILFGTDEGIYEWDPKKETIVYSDMFRPYSFTHSFINKIYELNDSVACIISLGQIRWLKMRPDGYYQSKETIFKKLRGKLVGSYEYIWQYNPSNIFIGTERGFVHYDPSVDLQIQQSYPTVIRKAEIVSSKDSLLFGGNYISAIQEVKEIGYSYNSLRFTYAALFYENSGDNVYQYYLEKIGGRSDSAWSSWTKATYKEFTHLPEGDYVFHVRAKNSYDTISKEAVYRFVILPPWYRTTIAYIVYGLIMLVVIYLIVRWVKKKIQRERMRMKEEKEKELLLMEKKYAEEKLLAENEIIQLKNQKLETEVGYKNNELSVLATNLSQKSEFLVQLKKDLLDICKEIDAPKNSSLIKLIKNIETGAEFDNYWDQFQLNFDQAHDHFLSKLRERYPALKSSDLLLCAYIKINKSNKEIASLLNISVSAVEKRRYRLREKLELNDDTRLTEYLISL